MSDPVQFVKNEIIGFFEERKSDVGHVLHTPAFLHQRMMHWNPKQKDSLDQAIEELTSEGVIEVKDEKISITEAGVNKIYPEVGNSVRNDILGFFIDSKADAGHVLNTQAFYHQRMTHWNPKQKNAFDATLSKLIEDGIIEYTNEKISLTSKGVNEIY
ncbi:putative transcriptional regulator [Hydrogenophaga palleronii]|uniref:Transcriptional regulator n=1 Tax=Hydrogenophaga palleronii TaxID=65655 RepID=A0ABU1WPW9_9BURK|nr:hypothetical protein [Hydrogenophaga palleronii]MDR7151335.1 putative transcriptional regulator [Hydrogenophaga palleronii]